MATLTSAISASAPVIRVSGDTSAAVYGRAYRIDSEVVVLREFVRYPHLWSPRDRSRWSVSRGQEGTPAASHSGGATIYAVNDAVTTGSNLTPPTPYPSGGAGVTVTGSQGGGPFSATSLSLPGTAVDLGGGSVGVGLVTAKIGPFPLDMTNYDTDQSIVALDDGTIVLSFFPIVRALPDQGGADDLLCRCQIAHGGSATILARYTLVNDAWADADPYAVIPDAIVSYSGDIPRLAIGQDAASLTVRLFIVGTGTPTGGEVDMYAMIATPAS